MDSGTLTGSFYSVVTGSEVCEGAVIWDTANVVNRAMQDLCTTVRSEV